MGASKAPGRYCHDAAPILERFFCERLLGQRGASPNTIAAYRDTFRLLLSFVKERYRKLPWKLDLSDLDAPVIGAFLEYLEHDRHNSVRSRNARLAALRSFYRFASMNAPEHSGLIQRVLAISLKRQDRALVCFLDPLEIQALLASPDRTTWVGRRDHALLVLAVQTGLRVSELTGLCWRDAQLGTGVASSSVRCLGKGRKERATPLTSKTAAVLRVWRREQSVEPPDPVFPTRRGEHLSRDAVERLVARHTTKASRVCPSLALKRVTPHVLRHTCAMQLLQAGVDTSTIALLLGHEGVVTTQIYLHADLALKERALARITPPHVRPGRYRAPKAIMAFSGQPVIMPMSAAGRGPIRTRSPTRWRALSA